MVYLLLSLLSSHRWATKKEKSINFIAASLVTPYIFSLTFITNNVVPLKARPSERLNFCKKSKD